MSRSVITNNLIIGGKLDHLDTKKEEDEETKKQRLGDWSTQLTGSLDSQERAQACAWAKFDFDAIQHEVSISSRDDELICDFLIF